jgi:hypothetical protein
VPLTEGVHVPLNFAIHSYCYVFQTLLDLYKAI